MRQFVKKTLSAIDASDNSNGPAINAEYLLYASIQTVMTGTSSGTIKLQYSNDIVNPRVPPTAPTNWSDVPSATVTITGTAGVFSIPKTDLCYQWIRVVFVKNNGSAGTATSNISCIGA